MKKILALLLAVLMVVPMGTVAMAAEEGAEGTEPPIVISTGPDTEMIYSINGDYGYSFLYRENSPITGVRFENGRMEAVCKKGLAKIKLVDPDYSRLQNYRPALDDESFKDTMIFSFEDGREFSYPIYFTYFSPNIGIKWTSTGTWEEGDSFFSSDKWIPLGGTATYHVRVVDKLGLAVLPFRIEISSNTTSNTIIDGVEKYFELNELATNENEGTVSFTVTNLITPEMAKIYIATESINVKISDSTDRLYTQATGGMMLHVDTYRQPPDGFEPDKPAKPTDPEDPDQPDKPIDPEEPDEPDQPSKPTTPGKVTESPEQAEYTANKAAEDAAVDVVREANAALAAGKELPAKAQSVTTAAGTAITVVPVKLYGMEASIYLDTMDLLATGKVGLKASINSGAAEVILPAGFTHTPEPGRFGYPLGFQKDPRDASLMTELVKGDTAKTETYKLGGNVVLPTTATVTIKTKLDGKVNVYYWNDETRKYTLLDTPTAEDGRVTFATKQLGHLLVTTGTV